VLSAENEVSYEVQSTKTSNDTYINLAHIIRKEEAWLVEK
jgi:hypothetical protein